MDLDTVTAEEFARALNGVGVNILTRDASVLAEFLVNVFGVTAHHVSSDFAIIAHQNTLFQLHSDASYAGHPLHPLLPESGPRATGIQIYLFDIAPDAVAERAEAFGGVLIEPPQNKGHGLREVTVLAPEGQAFTAAMPLP